MKPVLTVFMDGLRPDSLNYMPFLNSFPVKKRLRTILGYSITCHASMYTGVYPNKHLLWFTWLYNPQTSPFKFVKPFKNLSVLNLLPFKIALVKLANLRANNTSYFGIPYIVSLPVKFWPYIDVAEKKLWNEPGYLQTYPTIFDILRKENLDFEIIGMDKSVRDESVIIDRYKFKEVKPWMYLFMGDVDHFSHQYGQHSQEGIKRLRALDKLLERKLREYEKIAGDFHFILFSDHGHIMVRNRIDPYEFFEKRGVKLQNFLHVVDANFIRFWFHEEKPTVVERIKTILGELPGYILSEDLMVKYKVNMPDNRYGDLIFYLDAPNVFSRTMWGYSRRKISNHGYSPDLPESDGVFVSNFLVAERNYVELVDILPLHLKLLKLEIPSYIDGYPL